MARTGDKRQVLCPRCDTALEVSRNAKSTLCPGCHQNIRCEDDEVSTYCARRECFTEGSVTVAKKGVLIAEVRVQVLVVHGEVKGSVRARQSVLITKTGRVYGDVRTPVLTVENGGALIGRCEFGPAFALRASAGDAPSKAGAAAQ